jgi:hypothetical protein
MRLLRSSDITLHEFHEAIPDYAILSHRWTGTEISFQNLVDGLTDEERQSSGYGKIVDSCRVAQKHELEWMWIDTCCIGIYALSLERSPYRTETPCRQIELYRAV